jgi:site-specific DNA recombinase
MPTERLSMRHIREVLRLHYSVGMSQRAVERAERRARLVSAIMRGRGWLDEIMTGSITDPEQLAKREQCSLRQVNLTLSTLRQTDEGLMHRGHDLWLATLRWVSENK